MIGDENKVDWVLPGDVDAPVGGAVENLTEINRTQGHILQPTELDPVTGKPIRIRVDRIIVKGMPAPKPK